MNLIHKKDLFIVSTAGKDSKGTGVAYETK